METMNVSLPQGLKDFVETQVTQGGFSTASEYIRQLIREAQKRSTIDVLESILLAGIDSGEATEMSHNDWIQIKKKARESNKKSANYRR